LAAPADLLVSQGFAHVRCHDLAGLYGSATATGLKHGGVFTVELFDKDAPQTVANFLRYVDDGFFDGTIFHRIVPGFVIQGGGLTADFSQKKTRAPVKNEAANGVRNARHAVDGAHR
jgi:peptidyl-prolyl cis-trans isomerase B (cyclophilin B)